MINRWRLEKADPRPKLSPPKKQIIWYVEDTVPHEYRPFVEEGIREWNKAFEKIGFRDAIAVRWQESGRDEFDPEDINYCTFRWITTNQTYAMSCLRSNPLTGEMIDGDVIFDASWIRYWKQEYALLTGSTAISGPNRDDASTATSRADSRRRDHQPDHGRQARIRTALPTCRRLESMLDSGRSPRLADRPRSRSGWNETPGPPSPAPDDGSDSPPVSTQAGCVPSSVLRRNRDGRQKDKRRWRMSRSSPRSSSAR